MISNEVRERAILTPDNRITFVGGGFNGLVPVDDFISALREVAESSRGKVILHEYSTVIEKRSEDSYHIYSTDQEEPYHVTAIGERSVVNILDRFYL